MKLKLFVLFVPMLLILGPAAHAQASLVDTPQIVQVPEHVLHAEQHAMAQEHSLVGGGSDTYSYARGEEPLWEFGPVTQPVPLGDVARAYRQQKLTAKKAEIIFEKDGSNDPKTR
ncbi:MAG TPA: hypothetical protein VMD99_16180 [Terriglobales bacterium]|nr:hypothetical protein [Terriglobales bacterium]